MDFSLSPDLPAQYCYLIVLLLGFFVASVQVERLFQGFPRAWIMFSTWILFFTFLLVPVVLFWFLDRTDTLHDTSLFAALLVAIGYRQIFGGSIEKVAVQGQASKIWEGVVRWVDERAKRIREKMERNAESFDEKVISYLTDNPGEFAKVHELLQFHAADYGGIEKQLNEGLAKWEPLGDVVKTRKVADFLYRKLRLVTGPQFTELMYRHGITTWRDYYWYGKELRSRLVQFLVIGALMASSLYLFYQIFLNPAFQADYLILRLKKANATEQDRSRTRREIGSLITDQNIAQHFCTKLTDALRYEALSVETAERILAVLVERRASICKGEDGLPLSLAYALRAPNPDVRLRIHNAVLFLAVERGGAVEQTLKVWKPTQSDAATDVEQMVQGWERFWKTKPIPGSRPPDTQPTPPPGQAPGKK